MIVSFFYSTYVKDKCSSGEVTKEGWDQEGSQHPPGPLAGIRWRRAVTC